MEFVRIQERYDTLRTRNAALEREVASFDMDKDFWSFEKDELLARLELLETEVTSLKSAGGLGKCLVSDAGADEVALCARMVAKRDTLAAEVGVLQINIAHLQASEALAVREGG